MKSRLFIIVTVIIYFSLGCSQIQSLDSESSNSKVIIDKPKSEEIIQKPNDGDSCQLTGGEIVTNGWSGKDTGLNYCNQCTCMIGFDSLISFTCTEMACIPEPSIKNPFAYLDFWKCYKSPETEAQVVVRGFNVGSKADYAEQLTGIENIMFHEAKEWEPPSGWTNPYI